MGFWSSIKKAVKKAWRAVKATVRAIVKIVVEIIYRIINLVFFWLPIKKKLRIQVFILRDELDKSILPNPIPNVSPPVVVTEKELTIAVNYAVKTFMDKFDVTMKPYGRPIIQTLSNAAPTAALDVKCNAGAASNEWAEAGEYFASNLAGWNLIPISLGFPLTVYVLRDISGKIGCSLGPLTDYVTLSIKGAKSESTMAHELGHACGLLHRTSIDNLMYPNDGRGNNATSWQKFVVRNSRHCTFW